MASSIWLGATTLLHHLWHSQDDLQRRQEAAEKAINVAQLHSQAFCGSLCVNGVVLTHLHCSWGELPEHRMAAWQQNQTSVECSCRQECTLSAREWHLCLWKMSSYAFAVVSACTMQAVYTALKETEQRATDVLPLWKITALAPLIPRQRKALQAVSLIRQTTEELIAKCKQMVDAEEQASHESSWLAWHCFCSVFCCCYTESACCIHCCFIIGHCVLCVSCRTTLLQLVRKHLTFGSICGLLRHYLSEASNDMPAPAVYLSFVYLCSSIE